MATTKAKHEMQGMRILTFAIVYVALDAILRGLPTRAKHVSVWNTYTEIVTNHQVEVTIVVNVGCHDLPG